MFLNKLFRKLKVQYGIIKDITFNDFDHDKGYKFIKEYKSIDMHKDQIQKIIENEKKYNKKSTKIKKYTNNILKQLYSIHKNTLCDIIYKKDIYTYDQTEYWATSDETLSKGYGDCIANYEKIYTIDGIKKVGDLVVGDLVLSYDFNKNDYCYKPITKIWNKGKLPIYRVLTGKGSNIRQVDVTINSNFIVRYKNNKSEYKKKKLSEINENCPYKRNIPISTKIPYTIADIEWINEDLCFVIGYYIADGWYSGSKVGMSGYDIDIIKEILDKNNINYTNRKTIKTVPCINILQSKFKDLLKEFKINSYNINIPEWFFKLPANKLYSFLMGYFLGDGHIKHNYIHFYSTISDQLASDILRIHLQLGLPIDGYKQVKHQGLGDKPIWRLYSNPKSISFRHRGYNNLGEIAIRKKEYIGDFECRDFEVQDTHVFFTKNGIMCHNCEDQAILLFRRFLEFNVNNDDLMIIMLDGHITLGLSCTIDKSNFLVFDNGNITYVPTLASNIFPYKKDDKIIMPLMGFNLDKTWYFNNLEETEDACKIY